MELGVNNFAPAFSSELALDDTTSNVSTGINRGVHPRYGMSPIPGHSNLDTPVAENLRGLRASEQSGDISEEFVDRKKFLGVVPISVANYDNLAVISNSASQRGNQLVWILTDLNSTTQHISAVANCEYVDNSPSDPNLFKYKFDAAYGFANNLRDQILIDFTSNGLEGVNSPLFRHLNFPATYSGGLEAIIAQKLQISSEVFFSSVSTISVSGRSFQQQWLIGQKVANGTALTTATANFSKTNLFGVGSSVEVAGLSPSWVYKNYKINTRTLSYWNLASKLLQKFIYENYGVDETTFVGTMNQIVTTSNINMVGNATAAAPKRGGTYVPADVEQVLLNDNDGYIDSSYRMIMVAAKAPYAFVVQDWERDRSGRNVQLVSLTDRRVTPPVYSTFALPGPGLYKESGNATSTCFYAWPSYDPATALAKESVLPKSGTPGQHVALGDANSGILRANTTYEFTYSIFDKQYGIESNVGTPAKFKTGTDDFVALCIYRDGYSSSQYQQDVPVRVAGIPFQDVLFRTAYEPINKMPLAMNQTEFRFYYRPLGSFEWLPALFIDTAKLFYYPDFVNLYACTGTAVGTVGGQPGGFNDYSQLPLDQYDCVITYKGRAFWISKKNLVFSLRDNPFAYPLRNSAQAPAGGWNGGIVHTYRGQSEQQSRIVIFGAQETYIGKFTGIPLQTSVQVSPDTVAQFDLDGSDFTIETWTSITSFSHRSAVVADGDLYWWGPQGIYFDNGVSNPEKVSGVLEPNIYKYYDPSKTDEIHCTYDEKTKEIIWFYPPASDNTTSHALVYNTVTDQFFHQVMGCKVDWSTRIDTSNPGVTQKTNTLRTILSVRETSSGTVQRGVFFDSYNRSGDYCPTKELLVKTVASGSTSRQKVLTLDSGVDGTAFATITVGDLIALQQFKDYTGQTTGSDLVAKVISRDTLAKTILVNLPEGAVLPNVSLTDQRQFFPVWHAAANGAGLNGITYNWQTKYWMPANPENFLIWQYIYMFFKYTPWKRIDQNTFNMAYKTPSGGPFITDQIKMVDNSDSNFQVYHALRTACLNNIGQALKLKLSGVHIGDEWVLQYLEAHTSEETGNVLKTYQG